MGFLRASPAKRTIERALNVVLRFCYPTRQQSTTLNVMESFLQDQPRCQQHQARAVRRRPQAAFNQGPKLLACLLGSEYSLHWDAAWGQRRQPKARSPTRFSSKLTPSPMVGDADGVYLANSKFLVRRRKCLSN